MTRRIIFRTAASESVGFGHLRRCLTLAEALRARRSECFFAIHGGAAGVDEARRAGFDAVPVAVDDQGSGVAAGDPDAIVADSYDFDVAHYRGFRKLTRTLVVLDDGGDRALPADVVINPAADAVRAYDSSSISVRLLGPKYALLRSSFEAEPCREVRQEVRRILVTLGGGDAFGLSAQIADAVSCFSPRLRVDVVLGPFAREDAALEQLAERRAVHLHRNPRDMRALMVAADIAISGGGQTTYELAATGTPTVALCLAENQRANLQSLAALGILQVVEARTADRLRTELIAALAGVISDPERRLKMSGNGRAVVDGKGATRVADAIVERTGGDS
ncbi:MAG: UDP-2,4-diacetamido-2,4,6-trideoxy-beta-L-altropyranose hydrolase [Thermoanaerobaculia bacterium]